MISSPPNLQGLKAVFRKPWNSTTPPLTAPITTISFRIEAMACELLADFYLSWNDQEEAGVFIRRAQHCYIFWGATAKEQDLRERYPDLLLRRKNSRIRRHRQRNNLVGIHLPNAGSFHGHAGLPGHLQRDQAGSSSAANHAYVHRQRRRPAGIPHSGIRRPVAVQASEDVSTGENRVLQAIPLDECEGLSAAIVHYVSDSGNTSFSATPSRKGTSGMTPIFWKIVANPSCACPF